MLQMIYVHIILAIAKKPVPQEIWTKDILKIILIMNQTVYANLTNVISMASSWQLYTLASNSLKEIYLWRRHGHCRTRLRHSKFAFIFLGTKTVKHCSVNLINFFGCRAVNIRPASLSLVYTAAEYLVKLLNISTSTVQYSLAQTEKVKSGL